MPDINSYNVAVELGKKKDAVGAALVTVATTAQLVDKSHAVNTVGKYAGKQVFNVTTNILVCAIGTGSTATWNNCGTGAVAHTPA